MWGVIIYNNCCQISFSLSEYTKIAVFATDSTGEAYSAPPDPLAGFKGASSRQEGNGEEERDGLGVGRKRERTGKGEMGKGKGKGEVGVGIVPWLLGIDAPGRQG